MSYFRLLNIVKNSAGAKSAGIYLFSNFFAKATSFLLVFIYSNPYYIKVEENGLLSLLNNGVYILIPFISLGILQSTSVDFFKLQKPEFSDAFTTSFVMPGIITVVSMLLMLVLKDRLNEFYNFPDAFCYLIPLLAFLSFCGEQLATIIRNQGQPYTFLKVTMVRVFIEMGLSVSLVVMFAWGWTGRAAGILVSNLVLLAIALFYYKKHGYLFGQVRKKYFTSELAFAIPVILMQCSTFCLYASDKFFLSYFNDNTEVGIYSYACIFSSIVIIVSSALIGYVRPTLYKALAQKTANVATIRRTFFFYLLGNFIGLLAVLIFTPVTYRLLINHNYYPGLDYFYLISIGYFFSTILSFVFAFMLFYRQRKKILMAAGFGIVLSLTLNSLFIKNMGAMGAAWAVCIGYFGMLLFSSIISQENFKFLFSSNNAATSIPGG